MLTPLVNYEGQISHFNSSGVSCLQFLANSTVGPIAKEEKNITILWIFCDSSSCSYNSLHIYESETLINSSRQFSIRHVLRRNNSQLLS